MNKHSMIADYKLELSAITEFNTDTKNSSNHDINHQKR